MVHTYKVYIESLVVLWECTCVFILVRGGAVLGVTNAGGAASLGQGTVSILSSFCSNIKAFQFIALTFLIHQPFPSRPP